jgi:hypothetical protein
MGIGPGPDGFASTTRPVFVQHGTVTGLDVHGVRTGRRPSLADILEDHALPRSGAPMRRVWTEPDRDYPGDTDLLFSRGQFTDRIRMTPADREGILAALANPDGLDALAAEARELGLLAEGEETAARIGDLVRRADFAGYALAVQDFLATPQFAKSVRDFLHDVLESGPAPGEDWDHGDIEAIERVRALLEQP